MVSKDDLLRALPMRGLRADVGTKSSRKGGAKAIVGLEPAAEFETVNAVPGELGPELPALRVVVHEVLPDPVEANELNNRVVGRRVVQEPLRRLALSAGNS